MCSMFKTTVDGEFSMMASILFAIAAAAQSHLRQAS
jgi:hypothetical protein